MKQVRNCNGISLIALLLLIILILGIILALRIIYPVKKISEEQSNEIINTVTNANKDTERAEEKEVINLSYTQFKAASMRSNTNTPITKEDLLEYIIRDVTVKEIEDANGEPLLEIQFNDTKNIYTLNNNGKITFKEK